MRGLALSLAVFVGNVAWGKPLSPPPPDVIPANGAVVPRNTKIWIFGPTGGVELADQSNLQPVTTTFTSIAIPPFASLTKQTPDGLLAPGQYSTEYSNFTVEDVIDTTPPPPPQVEVIAFPKVGSAVSRITVTAPSSPDTFLVIMGEPQMWEPASVFAAGANGSATAFDFPVGPQKLKVVLVDAAGNASEPVEVTATVPKDRACSVAPMLPLSLLALTLLGRRRHR